MRKTWTRQARPSTACGRKPYGIAVEGSACHELIEWSEPFTNSKLPKEQWI